jgi:hypothetical protein
MAVPPDGRDPQIMSFSSEKDCKKFMKMYNSSRWNPKVYSSKNAITKLGNKMRVIPFVLVILFGTSDSKDYTKPGVSLKQLDEDLYLCRRDYRNPDPDVYWPSDKKMFRWNTDEYLVRRCMSRKGYRIK